MVGMMVEQKIGAVLVMNGNRLVGIFTERDCLMRVLGAGIDPAATLVRDVMTEDPYCVTPNTSLSEAMAIVTNYRVRHLPGPSGAAAGGLAGMRSARACRTGAV